MRLSLNHYDHEKEKNLFEKFSDWATVATGSSAAFIIAGLTVLVWR
jgi:hypothetical protein